MILTTKIGGDNMSDYLDEIRNMPGMNGGNDDDYYDRINSIGADDIDLQAPRPEVKQKVKSVDDFDIGSELHSNKYGGTGDLSKTISKKMKNESPYEDNNKGTDADDDSDDPLKDIGYVSPDESDIQESYNSKSGHSHNKQPRQRRDNPYQDGGLKGMIRSLTSALIIALMGYFVIIPLFLHTLESVLHISPQWYDQYEDVTSEYFSGDLNTDIEQPIEKLENIKDGVEIKFKDITGIDIRPKLKEGKTIVLAPFIVSENNTSEDSYEIRVMINGDEYALEVDPLAMIKESSSNRAKLEISVLDREVVGTKFIEFVTVIGE